VIRWTGNWFESDGVFLYEIAKKRANLLIELRINPISSRFNWIMSNLVNYFSTVNSEWNFWKKTLAVERQAK
jgi:hypothetical protein